MNSNQSHDKEQAFALDAYGALPRSQPPAAMDARILAAAHAANARVARSPRRWTTGLATAAGAVLAVGIAWRGMDSQQSVLPVSSEPVTPRMQPAFKTESAAPARETHDAETGGNVERDRAAQPASAAVPAADPQLSSTDWEPPVSAREQKRNATAGALPAKGRPRDAVNANRESRESAAPSPFPASPPEPPPARDDEEAASPAVPAETVITQSPPRMAEPPPQLDEQARAPARSRPELASSLPAAESAGGSGYRQESLELGATDTKADSAAVGAAAAAPAAVTRSRAQGAVGASGAVTEMSIHAGTTSLPDAVAAARAALSRGDMDRTRSLARAIVERFGRASLPEDLRRYALD